MFEFSKAALVLVGIGSVYLFFIAPFLLPKRETNNEENTLVQEAEKYAAEITLRIGCSDIKRKICQSKLVKDFKAQVLVVIRDKDQNQDISPDFVLKENDILKILISPDNLISLKHTKGYSINGDEILQELSDNSEPNHNAVKSEEVKRIYEVLVPVGSELAGKSLQELSFRNVYGSSVLAVRHRDETILQNLNEIKLREGDMLLVYASEKNLAKLTSQRLAFVLSHYEKRHVAYKKAIPALLIAIGVVAAAALNLTTILMSGMIGCLLLVTTSILKPHEAYQ